MRDECEGVREMCVRGGCHKACTPTGGSISGDIHESPGDSEDQTAGSG